VFVFTDSAPKYSKRFRFYETIDRSIAQNLRAKFEEGFRVADRSKDLKGNRQATLQAITSALAGRP
jgi:hypothetical protein